MVWGMSMPSGFGDFWPHGAAEFDKTTREEGWPERLRQYYLNQPQQEQRRLLDYGENHAGYGAGYYGSYVRGKFTDEAGGSVYRFGSEKHPCSKPYSPIEPHEVPQYYTTERTHKSLGSFIQLSGLGWAVDSALKSIMERLEPEAHQFFPIELRMPKGRVFPEPYHLFVVGQYLDSFSRENSDPLSWTDCAPEYPDFYFYKYRKDKQGIVGLALSRSIFGAAHLWRERRFNGILTCFSDELREEIASANLRNPKLHRMIEV